MNRLPSREKCFIQWVVPMDGEIFKCPPVDMWSDIACLLEDWAPPQDWEGVEVRPEAVGMALGKISRSFRVPMRWWEQWEVFSHSTEKRP